MARKWIVWGLLLMLASGGAVWFVFWRDDDPTSVQVGRPKRMDIKDTVEGVGILTPTLQITVTPDVSGEVVEMYVREGDHVKKGTLLLKISASSYLSALQKQQAYHSKASVITERARLECAKAKLRYQREYANCTRQQELYERGMLSDVAFMNSKDMRREAQRNLEIAEKNVRSSEYDLQGALASVQEAKERLGLTNVYAPITGIVTHLNVEEGERVVGTREREGTDMLTISRLRDVSVHIDVNEDDIGKIQLGHVDFIRVESLTNYMPYMEGRVGEIAYLANKKASIDALTEFKVRVDISQASYRVLADKVPVKYPLRPGVSADVRILVAEKKDALSVPLSAVVTRPSTDEHKASVFFATSDEDLMEVVFLYEDGKAQLRRVQTGISDFRNIEITSGLRETDTIITGPYHVLSRLLEDQQPVRIARGGKKKRRGKKLRISFR